MVPTLISSGMAFLLITVLAILQVENAWRAKQLGSKSSSPVIGLLGAIILLISVLGIGLTWGTLSTYLREHTHRNNAVSTNTAQAEFGSVMSQLNSDPNAFAADRPISSRDSLEEVDFLAAKAEQNTIRTKNIKENHHATP